MHGVTTLAFAPDRSGRTRLQQLYQKAPARALFPDSGDAGVPLAVLLNTAGGLVGGDRIDIAVSVAAGGRVVVTQQAAEKVYRSPGEASRIDVQISVGAGGWLEWLPQETILFEAAQLRRACTADVAADARLLAGEILIFGRRARGEAFTRGLIEERWDVRRDGRAVWADAFRLDDDIGALIAAPAGLNGAAAVASVVFVADRAEEARDVARALLPAAQQTGVRAAATVVSGVLVVRWLSDDAMVLRLAYGRFWAAFRHRIGGLSAALPRLWWS